MENKLVSKQSILCNAILRSNQNRPETIIFDNFDTFLAWRFEHLEDIAGLQLQEVSSYSVVSFSVLKKSESDELSQD